MKTTRLRSVLLAVMATLLVGVTDASAQKPNIVVILTDDLDALLGTMNYAPNINRLVRDAGMNFRNAFVTNSVCCPSRSTLLRGQYTHSHQVYTNRPPIGGYQKFLALGRDSSTVATWLASAGYATSLLGKYLNGYPARQPTYVPPGWTDWHVAAGGNPYANYNYRLNENGAIREYGNKPSDYMTDVLKQRATDFIEQSVAAHKPFYLEVATFAPHGPSTPAPRHAALFPELRAPLTPSYSEPDAKVAARLDQQYKLRVQSMQGVDELVASLVATLEKNGSLANTYIFFTSDNGFHLGQHGLRAGKQTAYEEDIHVPLYVRGPGIRAGSTNDALVANVDFAPTFAQIAGARVPEFVEGRSLTPLLDGTTPRDWRDAVLVESYGGNAPDARPISPRARIDRGIKQPRYVALRTAGMTFVEYRNGERQLFDLKTDSAELHNLADSKPELATQFSQWAQRLHACAGAACRQADRR